MSFSRRVALLKQLNDPKFRQNEALIKNFYQALWDKILEENKVEHTSAVFNKETSDSLNDLETDALIKETIVDLKLSHEEVTLISEYRKHILELFNLASLNQLLIEAVPSKKNKMGAEESETLIYLMAIFIEKNEVGEQRENIDDRIKNLYPINSCMHESAFAKNVENLNSFAEFIADNEENRDKNIKKINWDDIPIWLAYLSKHPDDIVLVLSHMDRLLSILIHTKAFDLFFSNAVLMKALFANKEACKILFVNREAGKQLLKSPIALIELMKQRQTDYIDEFINNNKNEFYQIVPVTLKTMYDEKNHTLLAEVLGGDYQKKKPFNPVECAYMLIDDQVDFSIGPQLLLGSNVKTGIQIIETLRANNVLVMSNADFESLKKLQDSLTEKVKASKKKTKDSIKEIDTILNRAFITPRYSLLLSGFNENSDLARDYLFLKTIEVITKSTQDVSIGALRPPIELHKQVNILTENRVIKRKRLVSLNMNLPKAKLLHVAWGKEQITIFSQYAMSLEKLKRIAAEIKVECQLDSKEAIADTVALINHQYDNIIRNKHANTQGIIENVNRIMRQPIFPEVSELVNFVMIQDESTLTNISLNTSQEQSEVHQRLTPKRAAVLDFEKIIVEMERAYLEAHRSKHVENITESIHYKKHHAEFTALRKDCAQLVDPKEMMKRLIDEFSAEQEANSGLRRLRLPFFGIRNHKTNLEQYITLINQYPHEYHKGRLMAIALQHMFIAYPDIQTQHADIYRAVMSVTLPEKKTLLNQFDDKLKLSSSPVAVYERFVQQVKKHDSEYHTFMKNMNGAKLSDNEKYNAYMGNKSITLKKAKRIWPQMLAGLKNEWEFERSILLSNARDVLQELIRIHNTFKTDHKPSGFLKQYRDQDIKELCESLKKPLGFSVSQQDAKRFLRLKDTEVKVWLQAHQDMYASLRMNREAACVKHPVWMVSMHDDDGKRVAKYVEDSCFKSISVLTKETSRDSTIRNKTFSKAEHARNELKKMVYEVTGKRVDDALIKCNDADDVNSSYSCLNEATDAEKLYCAVLNHAGQGNLSDFVSRFQRMNLDVIESNQLADKRSVNLDIINNKIVLSIQYESNLANINHGSSNSYYARSKEFIQDGEFTEKENRAYAQSGINNRAHQLDYISPLWKVDLQITFDIKEGEPIVSANYSASAYDKKVSPYKPTAEVVNYICQAQKEREERKVVNRKK